MPARGLMGGAAGVAPGALMGALAALHARCPVRGVKPLVAFALRAHQLAAQQAGVGMLAWQWQQPQVAWQMWRLIGRLPVVAT